MHVPTSPDPSPAPRMRSAAVRAFLALITALGLIAGASALPASAAPPPFYAGLGDSVAAGTGGSTVVDPQCLRTAQAYPTQLGGVNAACFGATTGHLAAQADAAGVNAATKRVTITIGANDINAGGVAAACLAAPSSTTCTDALAYSSNVLLPQLPGKIAAAIADVKAKAPRAVVTLTGYPLLFTVLGLPLEQRQAAGQINLAVAALNSTIATAALGNGALYADVSLRFLGHGIGSPQPWIHAPGAGTDPLVAFHPNDTGYTYGYVPAVRPFVR